MTTSPENIDGLECSCYGCAIARERAGIRPPDRSAEPCDPPDACATHGRCWTHSEWTADRFTDHQEKPRT